MKVCAILYHKNAYSLLKPSWITKCIHSIQNQTFQDFDVLELNYDQTNKQLYPGSIYEQKILPNHVHAMNHLIHKARDMGYDYIFNINLDDYYDLERFEIQLKYLQTYDMVASNFYIIKDKHGQEYVLDKKQNNNYNIVKELKNNYNPIPHPSVGWKRSFFDSLTYYDEIPEEDLRLWQRAIETKTMYIVPHFLLYYRIHDNQITQQKKVNNNEIIKKSIEDFCACFEKTTKVFLTWNTITSLFHQWWKKFHPYKPIPSDNIRRTIIDAKWGEPVPRQGWFVKMKNTCMSE